MVSGGISDCIGRAFLALALTGIALAGCWTKGPEVTRLQARPGTPTLAIQPGEHPLGLGGRRDGTLYVPNRVTPRMPAPLIVLMHGGGAGKDYFRFTYPLAEELGIVVLNLDSRDNTWDGVDSRFGPDVMFLDRALQYTFDRIAIDARRLALGGVSDGASYALSLGLVNGDLFTHLVAFSPGFIANAGPAVGLPLIFVAHGTRDDVLPIWWTSRRFVPRLKSAGYNVTYHEFDGPHNTPPQIAREALEWLAR